MSAQTPVAEPEVSFTHRQIVTILIGLMMGMFLAALDQTIVVSALRVIADDLKGLSAQAWVTTAYLITSTIATPLYGKLSDIYGRKQFFIAAITIFTFGSALCALAWSIPSLAAFRAVQGVGAGGLFSLALAIIGDIVPPRERAKYQGYFLAVFGTSSVIGPVIGGFFAGQSTLLGITGWRWVFLVNVPVAAVALVVVVRTLHLRHHRLDHRIDWWGAVLLTVALVPLLIVAEQGREWGWTSASALLCYALGAAGLIGGFLVERAMGDEALIPLRLFRNRTMAVASITSVFVGMGMFGGLVSLPLYLQIVQGSSATAAGLQLIPLTFGIMFASILSGQLISRTGWYRFYPLIGSALMVVGLWLFHYVSADTSLLQVMLVMVVFGMGLGFNFQPLTLAIQNAVSPRDIGVATSSATFTRQIGGTLGTAVFLSILFSVARDKIAGAFTTIAPGADFQAALRSPSGDPSANAAFISQLRAGQASGDAGAAFGNALSDSSFLQQIDPRLARPFLVGFADAMSVVFLVAAAVLVLAVIASAFLPHVELRTGSAYDELRAERAGAEAAGAPVDGTGSGRPGLNPARPGMPAASSGNGAEPVIEPAAVGAPAPVGASRAGGTGPAGNGSAPMGASSAATAPVLAGDRPDAQADAVDAGSAVHRSPAFTDGSADSSRAARHEAASTKNRYVGRHRRN